MPNLYDLFEGCFPTDRTRPFMQTPAGHAITYDDVETTVAAYGGVLAALGVGPGERVAVQVEKSPEAVLLYLAVMRAGAIYLPLNTAYTGDEMEYFLADAEPALVVCRPKDAARLEGHPDRHVLTLDADGSGTFTERAGSVSPMAGSVARTGDDVAAILYTSGTTGRSKGAMLTIDNLWSNAVTLRDAWGFTGDDVLLHALPIFHVHGLFVAIGCVLASGAQMVMVTKFDAGEIAALLERATVMMGVPTFYTRLLSHPGFDRGVCAHMRLFTSGSAPLLPETWQEFRERTGQAILERYGMTETGMSTSNPLDGERIPGSVGPPLSGISVRIVDDRGHALPAGEPGMLEVKGPNVFKGYWRMPEKTAEDFRPDGFFITGDIAKIDANGYVSIVGRSKDMIISGGLNVYPLEIEDAIDRLDGVIESAVIGLPDADLGERVVAVVKAEAAPPDAGDMIATLKTVLASYKVPKQIIFVDDLPRNVMGKVQKAELRKVHGGR